MARSQKEIARDRHELILTIKMAADEWWIIWYSILPWLRTMQLWDRNARRNNRKAGIDVRVTALLDPMSNEKLVLQ